MMLPDTMENEFQAAIPYFSQLKSEEMEITRGQRMLADITTRRAFGKTYKEMEAEKDAMLAEKQAELARKDAEIQTQLAKKDAEKQEALIKKEAELAEKEAEKEAEHKFSIKALLKLDISAEKIAEILGRDLGYVLKIIENIREQGSFDAK
jgi:hypothetical protein